MCVVFFFLLVCPGNRKQFTGVTDASSSAEDPRAAQRRLRPVQMHAERSRAHFRPKLLSVSVPPPTVPSREMEGLPVTLGAEGHRWHTRCVATARDGRLAGVKQTLVLMLRLRSDISSAASLQIYIYI